VIITRIKLISPESATGKSRELLEDLHTRFGTVPNMMREIANSPAVLDGYLRLNSSLSGGKLSAKVLEQLAPAISQANQCDYCLASHSVIGRLVGITAEQIRDSRRGTAVNPKIGALIRFARKLMDYRGRVSETDIEEIRRAGYDDNLIAQVALFIFTNDFNNVAKTVNDFPMAPEL
jgi:uncharacterized peroxidase-related enzyme